MQRDAKPLRGLMRREPSFRAWSDHDHASILLPPFYRVRTSEQANERRARDSNPQPLAGHLISNQLADFGRSPTNLRSRENCVAFACRMLSR